MPSMDNKFIRNASIINKNIITYKVLLSVVLDIFLLYVISLSDITYNLINPQQNIKISINLSSN